MTKEKSILITLILVIIFLLGFAFKSVTVINKEKKWHLNRELWIT